MTREEFYLPELPQTHIDAVSLALRQVADVVNHRDKIDISHSVRQVRIGLYDHGSFLSHSLRSFAMAELDADGLFVDSSRGGEVILAMVANQSVPIQVRTLLEFLSSYLARQQLIKDLQRSDREIADIDALALDADSRATQLVDDDLRVGKWRLAAENIARRAESDCISLEVAFKEPLMSVDEIKLRVPLHRRIYNHQPALRQAIDRVAAMSRGFKLGGDGVPPEIIQKFQALIDINSVQRFSAHLYRDAFVCGNGYLSFGIDNRPNMQLLKPELVRIVGVDAFEVLNLETGEYRTVDGKVLHLTGAKQVGSPYGMSVLEPFIQVSTTNEALDAAVNEVATMIPPPEYVEKASSWLKGIIDLRERTFVESSNRIVNMLGGATQSLKGASVDGIYFPGEEQMRDEASSARYRAS